MFDLSSIMTTEVFTVSPSSCILEARDLMRDKGVRHLPVVSEDGRLVGLLTQTDLLAASDSVLRERDSRLGVDHLPVEDAMVTGLATVSPGASLREAALYLEQHRFGCLPVVEGDRLVGIVTDTDFVAVAINLLEQLEASEPLET